PEDARGGDVRNELLERLDTAERRLRELQSEVEALRALALTDEPEAVLPPEPEALLRPAPETGWWQDDRGRWHESRRPEPESVPGSKPEREPQIAAASARGSKAEPSIWQREIRIDREVQLDDLLGAKGLAWAGGVVTLLGVV